jgi:hypothetical protein
VGIGHMIIRPRGEGKRGDDGGDGLLNSIIGRRDGEGAPL